MHMRLCRYPHRKTKGVYREKGEGELKRRDGQRYLRRFHIFFLWVVAKNHQELQGKAVTINRHARTAASKRKGLGVLKAKNI